MKKKKKKDELSEFEENIDSSELFDESENRSDALSEDELNMIRSSVKSARIDRSKLPPHDTSDRANFIRLVKQNKIVSACALFVAVALVIGAVVGTVMLGGRIININRPYTFEYADKKPVEVKASETVIDGMLYVDMYKIAELTRMIVSGSETRIQFTSANGTSLFFEDKSEYVFINGGRTTLFGKKLVTGITTDAVAYVSADKCLIPFTFLQSAVDKNTLRLEFHEDANTVLIKPKYVQYNSDPDTLHMKDVIFVTDNFDITVPETERPIYVYHYDIDVNPYINSITAEHLVLANKESPLGENYVPSGLTKLTCPTAPGRTFELQYDAATALYAMMLDMEQAGITDTYVTSAYRSYKYQYNLYENYVEKHMLEDGMSRAEAEKKASSYSARPGESEHQTGLCFDFTTTSMGGQLNEGFEKTDAFQWLSQNAYKYGFILRYPKTKVDKTGYDYEPWHYRFVGRQAASEMHFRGQCFEEYLGPAANEN